MKTLLANKHILMILAGLLFLGLVFWFSFDFVGGNLKSNPDQAIQEKLDVEITGENENLGEGLENEIEKYIEEDISELDVNEEVVDDENVDSEEAVEETGVEISVLPFFERQSAQNELRVGFMTDLHAKSSSGDTRADRVIKEFFRGSIDRFVEEMNNEFFPDFLLINGDVIEGTNRDEEIGSGELRSIKQIFDRTLIPKYWVVGNHDLRAVDKDLWKNSLEINYLTKSFDVRDYRVVILDSNFDIEGNDIKPGANYTRGYVPKRQIEWLERQLKTDKKKIVFMHHPPLWSVDVRSDSGLPFNAQELQKVFRENNVAAVFAGHIEDFYYDKIDGVKYFVIPGVIKNEKYKGTFAEISFRDDKVEMNVSYLGNNGKYRKVNIREIAE